jgi:hypothetical protein
MWEPRRLTTLWASMACYRNSFAFLPREFILVVRHPYFQCKKITILRLFHGTLQQTQFLCLLQVRYSTWTHKARLAHVSGTNSGWASFNAVISQNNAIMSPIMGWRGRSHEINIRCSLPRSKTVEVWNWSFNSTRCQLQGYMRNFVSPLLSIFAWRYNMTPPLHTGLFETHHFKIAGFHIFSLKTCRHVAPPLTAHVL